MPVPGACAQLRERHQPRVPRQRPAPQLHHAQELPHAHTALLAPPLHQTLGAAGTHRAPVQWRRQAQDNISPGQHSNASL